MVTSDVKVELAKIQEVLEHSEEETEEHYMKERFSIIRQLIAGGVGCGVCGFITNPMDVVKTKNQQYGGPKYGKFFATVERLFRKEGVQGFLKGAGTSVMIQCTYSAFRMGMYEPIKKLIGGKGGQGDKLSVKYTASFISGGLGAAAFSPLDLIKIRFQSNLPPNPKPFNGSILQGLITIYNEKGLTRGLYNGVGATVIRAACVTSAQLGSYDVIKNDILVERLNMKKDQNQTHFIASMLASLITTTVSSPADVVKTRVMNDHDRKVGGSLCHLKDIWKNEGASALFKGWTASYLRIGPHTVISLVIIEEMRMLLGLKTY